MSYETKNVNVVTFIIIIIITINIIVPFFALAYICN
jgi:hypothetical protein